GNEIDEWSPGPILIVGVEYFAGGLPVAVLVEIRGAWILVQEPGPDERRGGKIFLVRHGLGDKCAIIKLLAACFQFLPVFVPGALPAPVFLGVIQREQRGKADQHKQKTTDHLPAKQPAEQPSESWKMAACSL